MITPATFSGFMSALLHRREKCLEARVRLPVTVRERRRDDRRVLIDDPRLLPRHAAGLLRTQRAAVESALEADDADLLLAADLDAVRARLSLIAHSVASEPVVSRKTFFSPSGATPASASTSVGAFLIRENVVVQQAAVHLIDDRLAHFGRAVAGVGDEHAADDQSSQRLPYLSYTKCPPRAPRPSAAGRASTWVRTGAASPASARNPDAAAPSWSMRYFVSTRATSRGRC